MNLYAGWQATNSADLRGVAWPRRHAVRWSRFRAAFPAVDVMGAGLGLTFALALVAAVAFGLEESGRKVLVFGGLLMGAGVVLAAPFRSGLARGLSWALVAAMAAYFVVVEVVAEFVALPLALSPSVRQGLDALVGVVLAACFAGRLGRRLMGR